MSSWRRGATRGQSVNHRPRGRGQNINAQPQKMNMDQIASVSRSGGLDADGDTLKDLKVQEEYRQFIQKKLDQLSDAPKNEQTLDRQENILILLRKLREGIISSERKDAFALEAYETSLTFAILYDNHRQTASIIPHLIPNMYLECPGPHSQCRIMVTTALLHTILSRYPSQKDYRQLSSDLPSNFLPPNSKERRWLDSLSSSLRASNYAKFEALTTPISLSAIMNDEGTRYPNIMKDAFLHIVDTLRAATRSGTWQVIHSAYREFHCPPDYEDTRGWITRSLVLKPVHDFPLLDPQQWLEQQEQAGSVKRKEGVPGRWLVCRSR